MFMFIYQIKDICVQMTKNEIMAIGWKQAHMYGYVRSLGAGDSKQEVAHGSKCLKN